MNIRNLRFIFICLAVLAFGAAECRAELVDKIVAKVNGEIITLFELNQRVKPYLDQLKGREIGPEEKKAILGIKKQILNSMIDSILIQEEVQKLQMEPTDLEVDNEIKRGREQRGMTEQDFTEQLKREGGTLQEYREKTRRDIGSHRIIGVMVRRKVVVTDEELRAYYKKNQLEFGQASTIGLQLILVGKNFDIEKLVERIRSGEISFADAAKEYSIGPGAAQGGDMGEVEWSNLSGDWKLVLDGLKEGEISEPFDLQDGVGVLRVSKMKKGDVRPFEEVKESIRAKVYQPRLEKRFKDYMQSLRQKAVIQEML